MNAEIRREKAKLKAQIPDLLKMAKKKARARPRPRRKLRRRRWLTLRRFAF